MRSLLSSRTATALTAVMFALVASTIFAHQAAEPRSGDAKTAMLVCALCVVPILLAARASHLWVAVGLISLATAAHQGWSANLFTLVSDTFPRRAVASVVGIGGFAGSLSGMMISTATGYLLQWTGSYVPIFFVAASAYLVALAVVQVLVPELQPARMQEAL